MSEEMKSNMMQEIKTTMTPENFCYWLQGFFEIGQTPYLNTEQTAMVKRHLDLVFHKSPITHLTEIPVHYPPQDSTGSPPFPWDQIKVTC